MPKNIFVFITICVLLLSALNYARAGKLDSLTLWMLDVGQGESVLVRTAEHKTILFDGGPDDAVLAELGSVLPTWQKHIDLVILSHPHADHITGLISVIDRYEVGEVWTSGAQYSSANVDAFHSILQKIKLVPHFVNSTTLSSLGDTTLQVIHPPPGLSGTSPAQPHDATISVMISERGHKIFLTGDLNTEHENQIVRDCPPRECSIQANVLQIPHHGSLTGLEPSFLSATSPNVSLIPVGIKNFFHHPRQEILSRLRDADIPIFRTDIDGRITVVFIDSSCLIRTQKNGNITVPCPTFLPP